MEPISDTPEKYQGLPEVTDSSVANTDMDNDVALLADRISYTFRLFDYVCYLNEKAENRANYLIVANSVVALGLVSAIGLLPTSIFSTKIFTVCVCVCFFLFALSVLASVGAVLPRTYDKGIPINHGVIGKMEAEDYVNTLLGTTNYDIQYHFALEIHILCRIVNTRFAYVGWAATFFFIGISGTLILGVMKTIQFSLG